MNLFLGLLDITASFVMLVCMQIITRDAGFKTAAQRWSQSRRAVYAIVSASLFVLGIYRIDGGEPVYDAGAAISHVILVVFGVLMFPILRALNVISQDALNITDHLFDFRRHRE